MRVIPFFFHQKGGSRSNWYRDMFKPKRIKISSPKISMDLAAKFVIDSSKIAFIVDKFRKKYGPTFYSDPKRFDVDWTWRFHRTESIPELKGSHYL